MQIGKRAAARHVLGHDKMRRSRCGDLRQMRDADHLVIPPQPLHFGTNGVRDFAADVCVDLIEHEQGNGIMRSQRGFDRQHQS